LKVSAGMQQKPLWNYFSKKDSKDHPLTFFTFMLC